MFSGRTQVKPSQQPQHITRHTERKEERDFPEPISLDDPQSNKMALKRISRELKEMEHDPPEGVGYHVCDVPLVRNSKLIPRFTQFRLNFDTVRLQASR